MGLAGARVLITQGGGVLVVEGLGLDPRGASGALGAIITDMPKRTAITEAMVEKANQYYMTKIGTQEGPIELETVSPFLTSKYCAICRRKLEGKGDSLQCPNPECPNHTGVNRHTNAAQVITQRGRRKRQKKTQMGIT